MTAVDAQIKHNDDAPTIGLLLCRTKNEVVAERGQTHIDGSPDLVPYALRVTMIIRQEGESWKIAHRHGVPITAPRPLDTIAEGRR
jgi:ketosteroid isomerase-like protein